MRPLIHSLSSLVLFAALLAPLPAQAQVFGEAWENGIAGWRAVDNGAINVATDATLCSSHFQRETTLYGGGRAFSKAAIPVTGGKPYCVTAWVRGSVNSCPFIAVNTADANGSPAAQHWLIGQQNYANGYGGVVTPVTSDGAWHWYSSAFTMDAGATYAVMADEIWVSCAAGTADFDDIQLWAGACPTSPTGAAHVACSGATPVCLSGATCVQCAAGQTAACTGATPACDTAKNACVGCVTSADCKAAATPVCNTAKQVCVGCLTNADCKTPTAPICDAAGSTCRGCNADTDCGNATPACLGTGACTQCSPSNSTQCAAPDTVCSVAGLCQVCANLPYNGGFMVSGCSMSTDGHACIDSMAPSFCGCSTDSDCGGATSGMICNATLQKCLPGCSPAAGRNGCPAGLSCTSSDTTGAMTGVCTMGCNFDGDCAAAAGQPFCLKGSGGGAGICVACRGNADCATGQLCGGANSCVQCTANSTGACSAAGQGAACLPNGNCGCTADSDCGSATSGRTCDQGSNTCVPGCRTGGNGCPAGQVCQGSAPGACVAQPADMSMTAPDMGSAPALSGGGCACQVGGGPASGGPLGLSVLVGAVLWMVRRRARRQA